MNDVKVRRGFPLEQLVMWMCVRYRECMSAIFGDDNVSPLTFEQAMAYTQGFWAVVETETGAGFDYVTLGEYMDEKGEPSRVILAGGDITDCALIAGLVSKGVVTCAQLRKATMADISDMLKEHCDFPEIVSATVTHNTSFSLSEPDGERSAGSES